ncbi:Elongator complex protein 5 [Plasmopara halstedii]|uniref:Elongator complex protein 5 n=1 Tax=Plasmopara halstedii TaxID=4781 RepID=A0A0P1AZL0_PLAHL|nr:Elongator complex protein 5 [Plasmopara halstedii]CEG46898.1 Elongator complex protein 5 [Plasmopara halstedii]|eukprot:XP_024583267.1 Elongator complex protein 5 [Plasmopara halstedii]
MEEYLLHHCVTSGVTRTTDDASSWQTSGRAECVLVEENHQAHGSSRVILSAMLKLVVQSSKTTNVLLLTLDSPEVARSTHTSAKLTHIDYSADAANFQPSSFPESQLLEKILQDIKRVEETIKFKEGMSSRPMVVVLDSLNVLLQQISLQQVLRFLRQIRRNTVVGSIITRLNAGAESFEAAQALAAQATALVLVETHSSLTSYPLLSQERRRDIPKGMHGLVKLIWQKKNGRSSESVEYFQVLSNQVHFVATTNVKVSADTSSKSRDLNQTVDSTKSDAKRKCQIDAEPSSILDLNTNKHVNLPVHQEEVTFDLSITAEEQHIKKQVDLPYTHHVQHDNDRGSGGIDDKSGNITGRNQPRLMKETNSRVVDLSIGSQVKQLEIAPYLSAKIS